MSSTDLPERIFEKALTAVRGRDNNHAMALLVEAIKLKPEFAEAWVVRGNILHSIDKPFEALLHYDRALSVRATLHDAWNNRGLAFADLGLFAAAEQSFRRSAELMPSIEPHMGLANMFCSIMRLEDAANEYRAAMAIDGGLADAHFNLGVTLLGLGRWAEGFDEYQWRWNNTPYPPRAHRNYKKWDGESLAGKTIILYPEQGYGDEIMALRFAPMLKSIFPDASIILQARGPMLRLAETLRAPGLLVVPMNSDEEWKADYSCPLLDVPRVYDLGWGHIRNNADQGSYLRAPDRRSVEAWRQRIPGPLKVGLCWSSGTHLNTAKAAMLAKSIPLERLRGLALDGVQLVSLQKPREEIPADFPILDFMDECHDFADTAALIESLDMVVSVDTAVAHLAGALGVPTVNFVRFSGYWPWLAPNIADMPSRSIWYPQMVLARQPALNDWAAPIERAKAEISSTMRVE